MANYEDRPEFEDEGGPVKSFLEHLEDLRWMLIKSSVALGIAMLICLIAGDKVVGIIKRPLDHAKTRYPGTNQFVTLLFGTNRLGVFELSTEQQREFSLPTNRFFGVRLEPVVIGTNQVLAVRAETNPDSSSSWQPLKVDLVNLSPAGGFYVAFQVAFYGGLVLAAPFIFYFVALFVFPALRMKEKKYVYRGLGIGGALFAVGVSFCYFVLMPIALAASVQYSNWLGFSANQWKAEDYISFVCKFMLGMGLGFEMPVVILVLVKLGILDYAKLAAFRRYMIVVNLVLGAVLTTPEVITQIVMFVPLQLLYEISIWIAWWWERKDRKRAEAMEAGIE